MATPIHKLSRGQLRAWTLGHLKSKQDGNCCICGKVIELQVMGKGSQYVVDHDHETGMIRGVAHRSCNAGEGKAANAIGQWIAKSNKYADIIPAMERLLEYLKKPALAIMYPDHKSPEEKAEAQRLKTNKAAALRRARAKLKEAA